MKPKIIFSFLILIVTFGSFGQTVNIDGDPYGGNPYADINAAITAASNGDVILISGVHTETLSFGKSITLRGTDPTTDIIQAAASPASTGSGSSVISVITNPLDNDVITIENLGVRHGNDGSTNGGGINIDKVTGLITLRNLIIEDNHTSELGGGLAIAGSNVDIINCTIKNNNADKAGGGIIVAPNNGAGVNSVLNIKQSLIDNNEGLNGGGIYINGNPNFGDDYLMDVNIENSTVSNNNADSGSGAAGGGAIWSRTSTWTTNDGGDGTSANVRLQLVHSTFYNNSHAANPKNGIQGTGTNNTEFSAYNSIIVSADNLAKRAINFANLNTIQVKNCILGGLNAAPGGFLDNATRNNVRGKTATFAGLSGSLSNQGGDTQVITISLNSNSDDFCTASVTGVTLPTIDQTGYSRLGTPDAGAFEVRCDPPTGISNIDVAATGASFSWTDNVQAADGYEIVVVETGGDPDDVVDIVTSATLATGTIRTGVSGLMDATDYDFYIRSDCGSGELGPWSSATNFTTNFQGNLILNSRFTDAFGDASIDDWDGYGTGFRIDDIIGKNIGFINLSDGAFRQDIAVVPGITYSISFNYRWSTTAGSVNPNDLTPVIRDPNVSGVAGVLESLPSVNTSNDIWYSQNYLYTHPVNSDLDVVRLQFFKGTDVNEFSLYNVTVLEDLDLSSDFDYIFQNGSWSPSSPIGNSTSSDDLLVFNGFETISGDVEANNLTIRPWADVDLEGVLDISNQITVQTDGVLTFKSDASGSAQLESGSLSGDVTVERFIPAGNNTRRAFRFLSSGVTTTTSIRDNWQEGASSNTDNPAPGFGTHITGDVTDGVNGFDGTNSGQASLLVFDNATQTWSAISDTDVNTLDTGSAYNLFVRGDRSVDLTNSSQTPTNTTLRATGSLDTGNVDLSVDLASGNDEWSLVGNPYQAIVDFNALNLTGDIRTTFFYEWDPNASTEGAYNLKDNATPAQQMIQPGQSFFVQNSGTVTTAPGLEFTEAAKNPTGAVTAVFDDSQIAIADLELYNTNNVKLDVMKFRFEAGGNNAINDFDAFKLDNPNENIASLKSNTLLALERRDIPQQDEIVSLYVDQYQFTQYEFRLNTSNWDDNIEVFVVDNYLSTQTQIDSNQVYSFSVDSSIPESVATDRFELVFDNTTLGINDNAFGEGFSLYPNPTNDGLFSIKTQNLNSGDVEINIHNLMGQQVMTQNYDIPSNGEIDINARALSSGIYMVELNQNSQSFTTKLIIQ